MLTSSLVLLAIVLVQPQEDLLGRLAREQDRAGDAALSVDERLAAADAAIDARARLIASAGDDDRLAIWLVDQAAALLARLGRDGTDAAVLHGLATPSQRARAREAGEEAAHLLERAGTAATRSIERLTARPRPSIGVEDLAAERDVRAPFLAGRAALIRAAAATMRADRVRLAGEALQLLGPLALPDPRAEWARRTTMAIALSLRAAGEDERAAGEQLEAVIAEITRDGAPVAGSQVLADAALGLARLRAGVAWDECMASLLPVAAAHAGIAPRPHAGLLSATGRLRGTDQTRWTVLAADAIARGCVDAWQARPDDSEPLSRAVRTYEHVGDSGGSPALRALMLERVADLAGIVEPPALLDRLPPIAAFARAVRLSRDPARRAQAETLFAAVADRSDAPRLAPDALWEWAVLAASDRSERVEAVELLVRFARRFADVDPVRAEAAILNAIQRGARMRQSAREGMPAQHAARIRRAYLEALEVATTAFDSLPEMDRWRLERARLLLETPGERAAAVDLLEDIPAGSPVGAEAGALYVRLLVELLEEAHARLADLRRRGDREEATRVAGAAVTIARRASDWAAARGSPMLDRLRADLADALVESGEGEQAVPLCRDLIRRGAVVPGGRPRLQLALGRGLLAGDEGAAFAAFRELVAPFDGAPAGAPRPEEYWHAWTIMLELLAARGGDSARASEIRVQIRRLQTIDAELGGEPWKSRLVTLRDRVD